MDAIIRLSLGGVAVLLVLGVAIVARAGPGPDNDVDLVPIAWDNCSSLPNGPAQGSNQVDSDLDGYGNACDADYDNDPNNSVNTLDFSIFLSAFTGATPTTVTDHNGDGATTTTDFATFLAAFQSFPFQVGPSGLACAGISIPCVP
jgi:hypothetical protein